MPLAIKIDNDWIRRVGTIGDLTYSSRYPGGPYDASWTMLPNLRDRMLRAGRLISIYDGPTVVWSGKLADPDIAQGDYTAIGWMQWADTVPALDSSGNRASRPGAAYDSAVTRGFPAPAARTIPSFTQVFDPTTTTPEIQSLTGMFDAAATEQGLQWWFGPDGYFTMAAAPTTPQWQVLPGVVGDLGTADDTYASQLVARYYDSGTAAYATLTVTDPTPRGGWAEQVVDLTKRGPMTASRATTLLNNIIARGRNKLRWTNSVDVNENTIRTIGGQRARLTQIQAGQMVRLLGVTNPNNGQPYVDWIIGEATHKVAERTLTIAPMDVAARTLGSVIERAGGTLVNLAGSGNL